MKQKYEYVRLTLLLDGKDPEDQKIIAWLKARRTKSNNISDQLRRAVSLLMVEGQ